MTYDLFHDVHLCKCNALWHSLKLTISRESHSRERIRGCGNSRGLCLPLSTRSPPPQRLARRARSASTLRRPQQTPPTITDRQRDTDASAIAKHFANAAPRAIHTPSLLPTRLRASALPPGKHPRYVSATALCAPITALCALGFTGRGKLRTTPGVSP